MSIEGLNQDIKRLALHPGHSEIHIHSSIEGLNQEIERLVLQPGNAGRANRLDQVSSLRGCTPVEGHHSPFMDGELPVCSRTPTTGLFTRLRTQSGSSLSPVDDVPSDQRCFAEASPRINKFMAQLPPEGCERVLSRTISTDESRCEKLSNVAIKPVAGFQLLPSQGSAFRGVALLNSTPVPDECASGTSSANIAEETI